jgi:multidrug efflux pump subunit AcrB
MENFKEIKKSIPIIVTLGLLLGIITFPVKGFMFGLVVMIVFFGIVANAVLLLEFIDTTNEIEKKCDMMHQYEGRTEIHKGVYKGFRGGK